MSTKNNRSFFLNSLTVVILGVLLVLFVIFRVIYPVFNFQYQPESKTNRKGFFVREINQQRYWQINLKHHYPFSRIENSGFTSNKFYDDWKKIGKVYQDELGLYATETPLNSWEEFLSLITISPEINGKAGELISSGDSVFYLTPNGEYRAFANAATFESLGFDWQKVRPATGKEFQNLKRGQNITVYNTRYLPGSFVSVGGKLYRLEVGEKKKEIISDKIKKFVENNFSVITVPSEKITLAGELWCHTVFFRESCSFQKRTNRIFPRAEILIKIIDQNNFEIIKEKGRAKVHTFDKNDWQHNLTVFYLTLERIKTSLKQRYFIPPPRNSLGDLIVKLIKKFY